MSYSIPNQCTICSDTLLGPAPSSALIVAEANTNNVVQTYHKSCVERLASIAQLIDTSAFVRDVPQKVSGYLRTPETFDDQRDKVIADLRRQLEHATADRIPD